MFTSRLSRLAAPTRMGVAAVGFCCALSAATAFSITPDGIITTIAGTGTANAQLATPQSVAVDLAGNVYIASMHSYRILKVAAGTGVISTIAGGGGPFAGFFGDGGPATAALLNDPTGVALGPDGNLYIADSLNQRIRRVNLGTGIITTVAGSGTAGYGGDGGVATAAQLNNPYALAFDPAGDMYIADINNRRIRKVAAGTGIITTFAGTGASAYNGDGPATSANLSSPRGVAADASGNVYIADTGAYRIRKVATGTGIISTVAGTGVRAFSGENGPAISAQIADPIGTAVDAAGNVYFTDNSTSRVRKLTIATGLLTTVAGNGNPGYRGDGGLATAASLRQPTGVAVDGAGALYIADSFNHRVRKVAPPTVATLTLSTIAGTGTLGYNGEGAATAARLHYPEGVAVDTAGNVYIADSTNNRIRKVAAATGIISTVAGTGVPGFTGDGGPATSAQISRPIGMAADTAGNVYFADFNNHRVRKITVATGIISTVAGSGVAGFLGDGGPATAARIYNPAGVAVDESGNLYIADLNNLRIRKVTAGTSIITTIAGNGTEGVGGDGGPGPSAQLAYPRGVAVDAAGNVYIADTQNYRVRKVTAATGVITTLAGTVSGVTGYDGEAVLATLAKLTVPTGVAVDSGGNVYIADQSNQRIRKVSAATGVITTVVGAQEAGYGGDGGAGSAGQLNNPSGVAVDSAGNVYVADTFNHRVRKAAAGLPPPHPLTLVRSGTSAMLSWPGVPGASSYSVYRGTTPGGETLLASGVTNTVFTDSPVVANTTYYYRVTVVALGFESGYSNAVTFRPACASCSGDFDGDRRADVVVYRPSTGTWYALHSGTNYTTYLGINWGIGEDIPVPHDYDGDGQTDVAVYRPSNGTWYVLGSASGFIAYQWGVSLDVPVPADYDGDGKTDVAVYRPSNGTWYVLGSVSGFIAYQWGISLDIPVPADYDGDGKSDFAVYRPSTGTWYLLGSASGFIANQWGISSDIPVPADYDGDGKSDLAVYRPSTGMWYLLGSNSGFISFQWGQPEDVPAPNDYDGDGKADVVVFRPSTGDWYVLKSSTNFTTYTSHHWGVSSDVPLPRRP